MASLGFHKLAIKVSDNFSLNYL